MRRVQAEISTVELVANLSNVVTPSQGWPIVLPSGGEPGVRPVRNTAQPQLNTGDSHNFIRRARRARAREQPQLNSTTSTAAQQHSSTATDGSTDRMDQPIG